MNTNTAFEKLIRERGWWKGILSNRNAAGNYKSRFNEGRLSEATITSILVKAKWRFDGEGWQES